MRNLLAVGVFLGAMVGVLGIEQGFRNGFDRGIQGLETGQVQLQSVTGGFASYFQVRALAEGVPGVAATSARLEFAAVVTNPRGQQRSVLVRGVNFHQESKVTAFGTRIQDGISGPFSGFLSPEAWQRDGFLFPSETVRLTVSEGPSGGRSAEVPVNGTLERTYASDGQNYAVVDLETALTLLGAEGRVSTIALRLAPGLSADSWISENKDAFRGLGAVLVPWDVVADPLKTRLTSAAQGLFVVRDLILLGAFGIVLVLGRQDEQKGGRWLLPDPSRWPEFRREFLVIVGVGAVAWLVFWLVFPLVQGLLIQNLVSLYPFVGPPSLVWEPGWVVFLVPPGTLVAARALAALAARRKAGGTTGARGQTPPRRRQG